MSWVYKHLAQVVNELYFRRILGQAILYLLRPNSGLTRISFSWELEGKHQKQKNGCLIIITHNSIHQVCELIGKTQIIEKLIQYKCFVHRTFQSTFKHQSKHTSI
jgi:hypothetical protein